MESGAASLTSQLPVMPPARTAPVICQPSAARYPTGTVAKGQQRKSVDREIQPSAARESEQDGKGLPMASSPYREFCTGEAAWN